MDKKNKTPHIPLSSEEKAYLLKEIKDYYYNERDEDIGIIASESLLDFFISTLGKYIYNKALDDAKIWFDGKMEIIESDFYSIYK